MSPLPSRGPTNGPKWNLTLAFWGGAQQSGHNQNWLPHPCLLEGPQVGGFATQPLRSRRTLEEGTKSELATSPLFSRGPTFGLNCFVTPAFSGFLAKEPIDHLMEPSGCYFIWCKCGRHNALRSPNIPPFGGTNFGRPIHPCQRKVEPSQREGTGRGAPRLLAWGKVAQNDLPPFLGIVAIA